MPLLQQPVRSVSNVTQSEQRQIWFGHLLKTVWTVCPKNRIWEGIWFESDSPAVWTRPKWFITVDLVSANTTIIHVTSCEKKNQPGEEKLYSRTKQDQAKNPASRKGWKYYMEHILPLLRVLGFIFFDFLDFLSLPFFFLLFFFLSSSDEDAVEEESDIASEDFSELSQEDDEDKQTAWVEPGSSFLRAVKIDSNTNIRVQRYSHNIRTNYTRISLLCVGRRTCCQLFF